MPCAGSALFETFDPEGCTRAFFDRWARDPQSKYHETIQQVRERGGTDEEAAAIIRQGWATLGSEASRLGTALHLHAELVANRVAAQVPRELHQEVGQLQAFLRSKFVTDAGLTPYRTELSVAWCVDGHAITAGQIDCLYQSSDGLVTMVDFKRVSSKHPLDPWTRAFRGAYGKPPVEELPDTAFWRYSLQQVAPTHHQSGPLATLPALIAQCRFSSASQSLYNVMLRQVCADAWRARHNRPLLFTRVRVCCARCTGADAWGRLR